MRTAPCREIRHQLIEAARFGSLTPSVADHVAHCGDCSRFFDGQVRLSAALSAVAGQVRLGIAPPQIEPALLRELDRRKVPARRPGYRMAMVGGAIAAALVAGVLLRPRAEPPSEKTNPTPVLPAMAPVAKATLDPVRPASPKRRTPAPARPAVDAPDIVADVNSSPFIELPWTVPLGPGESASVVRMNLAVSALIAAGLPVDADPAGAAAADVVVGMDGRARAVRLVAISDTANSNRRIQ